MEKELWGFRFLVPFFAFCIRGILSFIVCADGIVSDWGFGKSVLPPGSWDVSTSFSSTSLLKVIRSTSFTRAGKPPNHSLSFRLNRSGKLPHHSPSFRLTRAGKPPLYSLSLSFTRAGKPSHHSLSFSFTRVGKLSQNSFSFRFVRAGKLLPRSPLF